MEKHWVHLPLHELVEYVGTPVYLAADVDAALKAAMTRAEQAEAVTRAPCPSCQQETTRAGQLELQLEELTHFSTRVHHELVAERDALKARVKELEGECDDIRNRRTHLNGEDCEQAEVAVQQAEKLLKDCITLFESEEYKSVWTIAHIHGCKAWKGPMVDVLAMKKAISHA